MKLFHGSHDSTAPVIKIGPFALGTADNIFDGIFASSDEDIAGSHGKYVHAYEAAAVASNSELNERIADIVEYLKTEIEADDTTIEELAFALADDICDDEFASILTPRTDSGDEFANASWEMQRLRGRVAAHLGFDAVEMDDEHGTSYLIVNPAVAAE